MKSENILSIDYGTHKVGFARSIEGVALPIGISYSREALSDARGYLDRYQISLVIYGCPHDLDGTPQIAVIRKIEQFISALQKNHKDVIFIGVDERYSTQFARFSLDSAGLSGGEVDDISAVILLENYLSCQ